MKYQKNKLFGFLLLFPLASFSQDKLSLEEAVTIALQQNFGIQVANTQYQIDSLNATKGNAGFWPTISSETGADYGNIFYSNQSFSSGADQNETVAQSWGAGTAIQMDWTIFDGKSMYATYERLKALAEKSREQLKAEMETTIANVYEAYFAVVYQQTLIDVWDKNLALYQERETLAKRRWELGTYSKLDFLQASLDLQSQMSTKKRLQIELEDSKAKFNFFLSRPPETPFVPVDTFNIPIVPSWEEVVSKSANNQTLAVLDKQVGIGEFMVKEAESAKKPVLAWNNRLGYNYDQSQAGFLQKNQQAVFSSGLTLRWLIFDGNKVNRNIQESRLQVQQYKLQREEGRQYVQLQAAQGLNQLRNAIEQLMFELESRVVAEEAIRVAAERYRLGSGTSLELKEIQRSYLELEARIVNALHRAKTAETALYKTMGMLIEK